MVVGHTRLLGGWVQRARPARCSASTATWATCISSPPTACSSRTLFHDIRLRPNWAAPVATRNMDVTDVSLHDENFWPSITQTPDGRVFLVDGGRTSLVRVDGLDSHQAPARADDHRHRRRSRRARDWFARAEAARQQAARQRHAHACRCARPRRRSMASSTTGPRRPIGRSSTAAARRPTSTATRAPTKSAPPSRVTGDRLFAAWRTTEKDLLEQQRRDAERPLQDTAAAST